METTLRGMIEKEIDAMLKPDTINSLVIQFKNEYPVTSIEDTLFGFVVGGVFSRFVTYIRLANKRSPNKKEFTEFLDIIKRRTMEIKGKIKYALEVRG